MALFWKSKSGKGKGNEVLLVDLGNGSAGAARVVFEKDGPRFIALHREPFPSLDAPSYEVLTEAMKKSLETALSKVLEVSKVKNTLPDEAYCFLSSPWGLSEARSIRYEKQADFKITESFLKDLRRSARQDMERELEGEEASAFEVISDESSRARLNGYPTRYPEGKVARAVELSSFLGVARKSAKKEVATIIERTFPHLDTTFLPAIYAYYRGLEEIAIVPHDYTFLDVRSEITDVVVVREECVVYSGSFPFGSAALMRSLARLLATTPEGVREKLESSHARSGGDPKMIEALGSIQEEWDSLFLDFARSAEGYGSLPRTLLFAAEPTLEWLIRDLLSGKYAPLIRRSPGSLSLHIFDIPFKDELLFEPTVAYDPFLGLAALYVEAGRRGK